MKIRVIVNPSAAAGAAEKKIPELRRLLDNYGVSADVVTTRHAEEAILLARQAAADGIEVLGVMGGDGTFNEVAQACLNPFGGAAFGPSLAFIPAGTGGDLKRNFGLSNDLEVAVRQLVLGERKPMDVGVLTSNATADGNGERVARAFFNVASVGISGLVCDLANGGSKVFGGTLTFLNTSLRATLKYRNVPLRILVDGETVHEGPTYVAAIANGRWFGGGMQIAPRALTNDGLLDVVVLGDYSTLGAIGLARAIYAGTHTSLSKTKVAQGRVVELFADGAIPSHALVETDGEVPPVQLPLRIEIIPAAITVCMPPTVET